MGHHKRYLTKAIVRETVELYLEALAEEMAEGDWVDAKGIGKIQVIQEEANTTLTSFEKGNKHVKTRVEKLLQTKMRLYVGFKQKCRKS